VGGGGFDLAVDGDSGRSWTVDLKVFSLFMIDSADILWYSGGDLQGTMPCSYFARDEEDLTRDGPNRVSASLLAKLRGRILHQYIPDPYPLLRHF
jgi:hypothetical protein